MQNTIAQSLIAIGLYTMSFEATALAFKSKINDYLIANDRARLPALYKACDTSFKTFEFCGPILIANNVIEQADLDQLTVIRKRRNQLTHEAYNRAFDLPVAEVMPDVKCLHRITRKVQGWSLPAHVTKEKEAANNFTISPAFFGFVAQIVEEMSYGKIDVRQNTEGG
jgi:hypothetical protein